MTGDRSDSRRLQELVAHVADGTPVDWDAVTTKAGGADAAIRNVRALSDAVGVRVAPSTRARADRLRAPSWVWPVVWVALARTIVGLAGVAGAPDLLAGRPAPLWLFGVFLFVFTAIGLLLLYGAARERRATYLGAFYVVVATAFAAVPTGQAIVAWPRLEPGLSALQHVRVDAFMPALLWAFIAVFPGVPHFMPIQRIARRATPVAIAAGVLLSAGHLAYQYLPGGGPGSWLRPFDARPRGFSLYWASLFLLGFAAMIVALWKTRIARDDERRRAAWFIGGIVGGMAPIVVMVITVNVWPGMRAWVMADPMTTGVVIYAFLLSIPITTAYAVLVRRVLDLRLVIHRAAQYLLTRYAVLALSVTPLVALAFYLYQERERSIVQLVTGPTALKLLALAALGIGLSRARARVMNAIDLVFLRGRPEAGPLLERVTARARMGRSAQEIASALCDTIAFGFHPASVAVIARTPDGLHFVAIAGNARPLSTDSALGALLGQSPDPLVMDFEEERSLARMLPPAEQEWVLDGDVRVLVPLTRADGDLIGAVSVGPRASELPFTSADRETLRALAASASSWLERVQGAFGPGAEGRTADAEEPARECPSCGVVADADGAVSCRCGVPVTDALLPRVPLGKFRLEHRLGAGGMGVVYRAIDLALDRHVAIKTLPRLSAEAAQRARREARAMAAVQHPNLALIYGVDSWRGTPLLVVEYLAGGTLTDRLARGTLTPVEAIDLGAALAAGLDHMHRSGVLHRDIKPSNIGFTAAGVPKLLDFGLARMTGHGALLSADTDAADRSLSETLTVDREACLTGSNRFVGTPIYMAPEAFRHEPPSPGFDLWSLALVLYESLAGSHPFKGGSIEQVVSRVIGASVPPIASVRADVPAPLSEYFRTALARDPRKRPASAHKVRELLLAAGSTIVTSTVHRGGS
jgi:tRNA A-37 threonylcarbamoyl transferase component Bud32